MGVADFLRNQLEPPNLLPEPGFGTLLATLARGLPILTGWPVERLRWSGGGIRAEGPRGVLEGRAAIVTLPASLLAAGALRFDPPLPPGHQEALHGLPLGLLTKFILPASGGDRLDLPPFAGAERRVVEGETRMTFVAWPFGRPHLEGFLGGDHAWALEREGQAAQVAHAREELVRLYGAKARRAIDWDRALVSRWGSDPFSLGAYSYARPGAAGARAVLSAPLADGRLVLAGEHCHPDLAGTVGGAWETGEAAAAAVATALSPGTADGGRDGSRSALLHGGGRDAAGLGRPDHGNGGSGLGRLPGEAQGVRRVDLSGVETIDTGGATLLLRAAGACETFEGASRPVAAVLERVRVAREQPEPRPNGPRLPLVSALGAWGVGVWRAMLVRIAFLGEAAATLVNAFRRRRQLRASEAIRHLDEAGRAPFPW